MKLTEAQPSIVGRSNLQAEFLAAPRRIVSCIESAFSSDLSQLPQLPGTWHPKTTEMVAGHWTDASPAARRGITILNNLAQSFPSCVTLEAMTRNIIRLKSVDVTVLMEVFNRFQQKAQQANTNSLFQTSALLAMVPIIPDGEPSSNEDALLRTALTLLPSIVVGSIGRKRGNLTPEEDSYLNLHGSDQPERIKIVRARYPDDSAVQDKIDVYDPDSQHVAQLRKDRESLKQEATGDVEITTDDSSYARFRKTEKRIKKR